MAEATYTPTYKQKYLNDLGASKQTNSFWTSAINQYYFNNENFNEIKIFIINSGICN